MKNSSSKTIAISIISIIVYKLYEISGLDSFLSATSIGYVFSFFMLGVFGLIPTLVLMGLVFELTRGTNDDRKKIIMDIFMHFKRWFKFIARSE